MLVIGSGSAGRRHARNLRALGVTDLHVYDPDGAAVEAAARETGATPAKSVEAALGTGMDAVLVATPPHLHTASAAAAVEAGAHLFIEKPLSHKADGIEEVLRRAQRKGLTVMMGYNLRFHSAVQKVKALIDDGSVGRVMTVRAEFGQYLGDWRPDRDYRQGYITKSATGGGIILDASHEIDHTLWWAGPAVSVYAAAGKLSDLEMETEDTALVIMRHRSGALSELHLDCAQRGYARSARVTGTEGTVEWRIEHGVTWKRQTRGDETHFPLTPDFAGTYVEEMRRFLGCIAGEAQPPVDGFGGLESLRAALAAKESAEKHREVLL